MLTAARVCGGNAVALTIIGILYRAKHLPLWWVFLILASANFVMAVVCWRRKPLNH